MDGAREINDLVAISRFEAKEKYRGMFEIQKSGDKTSSGEIGLDIRTHASPKVGQDQENTLEIFCSLNYFIIFIMVTSRTT